MRRLYSYLCSIYIEITCVVKSPKLYLYLRKTPTWAWLLIVLAIIVLCCWALARWPALVSSGQYVMPLLSFILAWILVTLPRRFVEHKGLLVIMFLVLVCLGIYVYSRKEMIGEYPLTATRLLYPVTSALSSFFPSRGDYQAWSCDVDGTFVFWYYLFHYLSYFFLAWMGFSLFGRQMLNRLSETLMTYREKDFFWGYSEGGNELAHDIIRKYPDEEPVFLLDDSDKADHAHNSKVIAHLGNSGIVAFNVDFDRLVTKPKYFRGGNRLWKRLNRNGRYFGGRRHFFITEDQDFNVKMALLVLRQLKNEVPNIPHRTILYVRSEQPYIDAFFQNELDSDPELKQKVAFKIFSQSDLTSRRFVQNHPVLELRNRLRPDGSEIISLDSEECVIRGHVRMLMLGLGWTGMDLLKKIVADAAFGDGFKLDITIIDDDYRYKHGHYQNVIDEANRHGIGIVVNPHVWVNDDDEIVDRGAEGARRRSVHVVNSTLFYSWLASKERILDFDRIIVALGNDELNINTALQLNRFRLNYLGPQHAGQDSRCMPEKIMVHVRDRDRYSYYTTQSSPIVTFGSINHIYTCDVLLAENMDKVAKLVNLVYNKSDVEIVPREVMLQALGRKGCEGEADQLWNTSIFNKDSSRAVALNINNIMTIVGGTDKFEARIANPAILERLANLEHLRWCAFHCMNGVKPWAIDKVTTPNGKLCFRSISSPARHACFVPFDELDKVAEHVNAIIELENRRTGEHRKKQNYKATDRRIIRHFNIFNTIISTTDGLDCSK